MTTSTTSKDETVHRSTARTWAGLALAAVALTGCSPASADDETTLDTRTAAPAETPASSGPAASYEAPPLGAIGADAPDGWEAQELGGLGFAIPPGWVRDPAFPETGARSAGWQSSGAQWSLGSDLPSSVSVNYSPGGSNTSLDLAVESGAAQLVDVPGDLEAAVGYRADDDIVLGRHITGVVYLHDVESGDDYRLMLSFPADDRSVDTIEGLIASARLTG